jgi:hypothetical protein
MTPEEIGALEAIDRQTIDCWRVNYSLAKAAAAGLTLQAWIEKRCNAGR